MKEQVRLIVPVIRKVSIKDADDTARDLIYWLTKSPQERLAALTFLVLQNLKKGQRIDKTKIVKRKLK